MYQDDPKGEAAKLRLRVFTAAARSHPLVKSKDRLFEHEEAEAKTTIAAEVGMPWEEIDRRLYADVLAFQRLESFQGYPDAVALLSRYNVAQLQACLYAAEGMTVTATQDLKTILRYAKLSRLLHDIRRVGPSIYVIDFSGPASVLRETRRYGVNFARFLPALLACKGWKMTAALQTPWKTLATLEISERSRYTSNLPPPEEFDSTVEEGFAAKFGEARDGWRLERETELLADGQTVFVPDFVFRHEDGTAVLFEIVGFWTPEYLAKKRETLRRFRGHNILLAVPERSLREGAEPGASVIVYKTAIKIEPVLKALEAARAQHPGGQPLTPPCGSSA
jgi:predicted nuclease of restriction endonuclease-like RecB superfamily